MDFFPEPPTPSATDDVDPVAFPSGLGMSLGVRVRGPVISRNLTDEIFDNYRNLRDMAPGEHAGRLRWGFEPNSDHHLPHHRDDGAWAPDHPVLHGEGGGGGPRSIDRDYWLWPLPPAGRLRVVCQWTARDIALTIQDLDAEPFLDAARRAQPLWPTA